MWIHAYRIPDNTKVLKQKLLYAGSKEALKRKLDGVVELQANDLDDIQDESLLTKVCHRV